MIPDDVVQDVIARASIEVVVGDYVTLKRAGSSMKGLCPFHNEKSPSFHVTPGKGLFYCFGCGAGGDVVHFIRQIEGLSFVEAVERLGQRVGIDIPRGNVDPVQVKRRRARRERMEGVLEAAGAFFRAQLESGEYEDARRYLAGRGVNSEAAETFKLGFAPEAWDALRDELQRRGHDLAIAEKAGLVVSREGQSKGFYDRFRNRLMFPVIDERGRMIAFGGRTLDPDVGAKYINSPESELYTKGRCLYGIHAAKEPMRRGGSAILVEGNLDVVRMHQFGFTSTVAPMGTAVTDEQAALIKRFSERVYVLFDGDKAGRKASERSLAPLLAQKLDARVVLLPDGEDPDSFLSVYGETGLQELIDASQPLAEWILETVCTRILEEPVERRVASLAPLDELLQVFDTGVARRHYLDEAARRLRFSPAELEQHLRAPDRAGAPKNDDPVLTSNAASGNWHGPLDPIEFELLKLLLDSRVRLGDFIESDGLLLLHDTRVAKLLERVWTLVGDTDPNAADGEAPIRDVVETLEDESLRRLAFEAIFAERDYGEELTDDWFRGTIARLTDRWALTEKARLGAELEDAFRTGDQERIAAINQRIGQIHRLRARASKDRMVNWDSRAE